MNNGTTPARKYQRYDETFTSATNANGTVFVTTTSGLTVTGNGTTNLVLSGLIPDLDAALQTLTYLSNPNAFGLDLLTVVSQDEDGQTNVVPTTVPFSGELPTLGGIPKVSLDSLNNPGSGRTLTNVVGIAMNTNLVQGITYDPTNNVVNVLPVGMQDGSTNRTSITVLGSVQRRHHAVDHHPGDHLPAAIDECGWGRDLHGDVCHADLQSADEFV